MSRTWHHGLKARERKFGSGFYRGYPEWKGDYCTSREPTPPKKKRNGPDSIKWMNTPMWWHREMHQVPHRAKTRLAIHRTMRLKDIEDWPIFPIHKKPHNYFW